MKRMQAILLAFIMVVMGILVTPTEGEKAQAEETATQDVNTDMLQVKVQFGTKGGEDIIRFVSSVDSLEYSKVGFDIQASNGEEFPYESQRVFKRIDTTNSGGVQYDFSPKVVDTSSKYFITANMYIDANVTYTVRAYVIPLNSTEKVYGNSRCISKTDDSPSTVVNVSFETTDTTIKKDDTINATYGKDSTPTTATVIDVDVKESSRTVHARVAVADRAALPSVTEFVFGEAGSAIYRNLYTTHKPAAGTTPIADTSWYDVNSSAKEFVLATTADLYGLAEIVNTTEEDFQGHTIYLASDMKLNETGDKTYAWTPIGGHGSSYDWFKGSFDGQMHTISGVHVSTAARAVGFFGAVTANTCEIRNFKMVDSSFHSSFKTSPFNAYIGSIAGYGNAKFKNIYSSANVSADYYAAGGIVGSVTGGDYVEFEQCQFAGTVTAQRFVGGIIGGNDQTYTGAIKISNCYCNGTLNATTNNGNGGICGRFSNNVTITDTVSNCTMILGNRYSSGSVLAYFTGSATLNNVYTRPNITCNGTSVEGVKDNYQGVPSASAGTISGTGSYKINDGKGPYDRNTAQTIGYTLNTDIWTEGDANTIPVLKIFAQ